MALEDLTEIQAELKTLSTASYEKLKKSILRHGITFPIFCWQSNGFNAVLDGTQRSRVLTKLKEDGYVIPPLPVDFIEAADEKEAKEKILILCSQYGQTDNDKIADFALLAGLDLIELEPLLDIPNIDFDYIRDGYLRDEPPTDADSTGTLTCPQCNYRGARKEFV